MPLLNGFTTVFKRIRSSRSGFLLCILLGTLGHSIAYAQPSSQQNLLVEQLKEMKTDSLQRVPVLAQLVQLCWLACPSDAIDYGEEALHLLEGKSMPAEETTLATYLPRLYVRSGNTRKAQVLVERGLLAAQRLGDNEKLAAIQFNQATIYSQEAKFILAEKAYQELLTTYLRLDHHNGVGSTYSNLGTIKKIEHDYGAALQYFQKALAAYERGGKAKNISVAYSVVADIYNKMGDYQNALMAISQSIALIEPTTHPSNYVAAQVFLADVYRNRGEPELAKDVYQQALTLARANKVDTVISLILKKLARLALVEQEIQLAQSYYLQAEKALHSVTIERNFELDIVGAMLAVETDSAEQLTRLLAEITRAIEGENKGQSTISYLDPLIALLREHGYWQEAALLLDLYLEEYQRRVTQKREARLAQFDAIYQASEKERKISRLERENNTKSIALLTEKAARHQVIFVSVVVAIVMFVLIYLSSQKRKVLQIQAKLIKNAAEKKKRLFSDISHELRTPLSVLKLQLEGLEHDLVDDPKETYRLLHNKLASINHLITDISSLAQADAGDLEMSFEPVLVQAFFQQWCEEFSPLSKEKGLEFRYQILLGEDDECVMDPERIIQVLNNLLFNSCRYTQAPGRIEFTVSSDNEQLHWCIQDSAPGLQTQQLDQIFERLYRVDPSRNRQTGGSGLGLTICKSFVEAHNGKIKGSHSELGGIRIEVTIPMSEVK